MTKYIRISNIPSKLGVYVISQLKVFGMNGFENYEDGKAFALLYTENDDVFRKATNFLKFVGIHFTTYNTEGNK